MIPEAAVEAAAKALNAYLSSPYDETDIHELHPEILVVLEAAAPHMLAAAIAQEYEAGADALGEGIPIYASNLRARAASIRAAK